MKKKHPHPSLLELEIYGTTEIFTPRRVYCVGANYRKHIEEMGLPGREKPFYFMKPSDALVIANPNETTKINFPPVTKSLHHEVELVTFIGKKGHNLNLKQSKDCIFGCAVGLDMTRRDIQNTLREKRQPWELAKAFDQSAPIGLIHDFESIKDITNLDISLSVNGKIRQKSNTSNMIYSTYEIISDLSKYFTLYPGDIIFTGTPEGVGSVVKGDIINAEIESISPIKLKIE